MTIILTRVHYFDGPVIMLHCVVYHRVSRRGSRLRYTRINTVHGRGMVNYTGVALLYHSSGIVVCYYRYRELRWYQSIRHFVLWVKSTHYPCLYSEVGVTVSTTIVKVVGPMEDSNYISPRLMVAYRG